MLLNERKSLCVDLFVDEQEAREDRGPLPLDENAGVLIDVPVLLGPFSANIFEA